MSNYVHLLIETSRVALSRIMQGLQLKYTRYFNKKYRRRYQAILCDQDACLLELVRYLHLNPEWMRAPISAARYRCISRIDSS